MRTLRRGMDGDDVAVLQERLRELGHRAVAVDGRFGSITQIAVMSFQRTKGLAVDGVVGPETWGALEGQPGTVQPDPGKGRARCLSLHIGLNRVDPAKYGGWDGALTGCENDARTMLAIAEAEGFTTTQLLTRQATTASVRDAIRAAARQLEAGGMFLLTYAGHGGQVPNTGTDPDVEDDHQDETWVLYDRQFLDDEIEQAFTAFKAGVNIVMLSDSCHSGSVHRAAGPVQQAYAELKQSFYLAVGVSRAGPGDDDPFDFFPHPVAQFREAVDAHAGERALHGARPPVVRYPGQSGANRGGPAEAATTTRNMPLAINIIVNEAQSRALVEAKTAAASRTVILANGLLISGCLDSQLSQEVGGNGVFTTALKRTWANNTFAGDYRSFHRMIQSQMGPTQSPALTTFGSDPESLTSRIPFGL